MVVLKRRRFLSSLRSNYKQKAGKISIYYKEPHKWSQVVENDEEWFVSERFVGDFDIGDLERLRGWKPYRRLLKGFRLDSCRYIYFYLYKISSYSNLKQKIYFF